MLSEDRIKELDRIADELTRLNEEEGEYVKARLDENIREMISLFYDDRGVDINPDEINEIMEAITDFYENLASDPKGIAS